MKIWIVGGSGLIGESLHAALNAEGHLVTILGRRARGTSHAWKALPGAPLPKLPAPDAVISLAGEPVAQRWTEPARKRIVESRVNGTHNLIQALTRLKHPPSYFLSASATGIYGNRGDELLDEQSAPGSGFLAGVCKDWEAAASTAQLNGMQVGIVRIAVVLAGHGGALPKMLPAFRAGLGGRLGSGQQWMPFIALIDVVALFQYLLANRMAGVFNATSPEPVRNLEFTKALGAVLHRPTILPVPEFALRMMFGDMSQMLLESQRVLPNACREFEFRYPRIEAALRAALDTGA